MPDIEGESPSTAPYHDGEDAVRTYYQRYHRPRTRGFNLSFRLDASVHQMLGRHIHPHSRCLDVGCGDGRSFGLWARDHGLSYIGVDIASTAVEKTRALGLEALIVDDSSSLPFPDGSFGAAVCLEVVEHLFQPEATLREAVRVLEPGGVMIVSTPNVAYWRRRVDLALLGRWNPFGYSLAVREPWADPHIRFFNPGSLARLVRKVGCEHVAVRGHGGSLLGDLPWLGHRLPPPWGSLHTPYRLLQYASPSLFGCFLIAVGWKPRLSETAG